MPSICQKWFVVMVAMTYLNDRFVADTSLGRRLENDGRASQTTCGRRPRQHKHGSLMTPRLKKVEDRSVYFLAHTSHRSNIKEVVKTGAGENNVHFRHLLGTMKLAWYLKSRFVGTHRCCQQRHTALTALQAALFGAT